MTIERGARLTIFVVGMLLIGGSTAAAADTRSAQVTTTPNQDTTTVVTATTTTEPATTTTSATTTSTTEPATTTTSSTTTTTVPVTPPSSKSDSSTPWGLIIAILAVIAVALIVVLVVLRRNANRDTREWKAAAGSALRDAELTRDMLSGEAQPGQAEEAARVTTVRANVERVAATFDALATSAPNDEARRNSIAVGTSLRGYFFALEAEQMLRDAPTTPSAEQLAAADAARRTRTNELDTALDAIRGYVTPKQ